MSDELEVSVPCFNVSSEEHEAFLCIPLANMFPDNERDDDQFCDDAYMEEVIIFETDDEVLDEDAVADDDTPTMIKPASKTAIEELEKVKIDERSLTSCSVCFEDVSIGTEARRLPCSHVYHTDCIVKWLQERNTCPLCRYQLAVVDFDLNSPLPALDSDVDSKNKTANN